MKYWYIALVVLIFAGCTGPTRLEIDGTAPGIKSGVFNIVDIKNKPVYGDNITDGKFSINELLEYPGYHMIKVTNMFDSKATHMPYEIYLEPGKYAIEINGADLSKYPKITTDSKTQQEVSTYYTLADELMADIQKQIKEKTEFLKSSEANSLPGNEYVAKVDELKAARIKEKEIEATLIEKFVEKYPQSEIAAHFIYSLDYKSDPVRYYNLFNKLSDAAKNTDEGKVLNERLARLIKLVPGGEGPAIYG
ncbi:MAG: hypothetical protein EOP54_18480, partial [Sphingobacteriales bacterium]